MVTSVMAVVGVLGLAYLGFRIGCWVMEVQDFMKHRDRLATQFSMDMLDIDVKHLRKSRHTQAQQLSEIRVRLAKLETFGGPVECEQ